MNEYEIYERIKQALSSAPRNQYTAELHLQMIKYADDLKTITAKEFCEGVGLRSSFGTEFSKMRNLLGRLKAAGMDTVERHNRTIRYSLISKHLFDTLEEVQDYATQWLWFYNHERPHKANGGKPPLMVA